jgi:ADP-dependent NAD(P)H-hydrate dehydratase / NAD(P)H-hydrate epimerase
MSRHRFITGPEILLAPAAMARVDTAAARSGIDSFGLMLRAGEAVAAAALRLFPDALRFVVLCGPGNNGGDGFVAATALSRAGAPVVVFCIADIGELMGDAARAAHECPLARFPLDSFCPAPGDVIVDALFGAGLSRHLPEDICSVIRKVREAKLPVLAVDLPSGIDGRTGEIKGEAFEAVHTVTFMTRKPGHVLLPGRLQCGSVEVFDIGIPRRIVEAEAGSLWINAPQIWAAEARSSSARDHKYSRGHLTVFSGPQTATGAARLSAEAALMAGAGLVTLASPETALAVNAAHLTAVMMTRIDTPGDLSAWLSDTRHSTYILGPGFGDLDRARNFALVIGESGRRLVLDADGLSAFQAGVDRLRRVFGKGESRLVITPHEGEFKRLFPDIAAVNSMGKVEKALAAAEALGGIVVYKGADTVIASPDGRAAIEENAPPTLATAGSGDVLAGMVGARLTNGMPAFEAACAGVYQHGQAARRAGRALTAEVLVRSILPD